MEVLVTSHRTRIKNRGAVLVEMLVLLTGLIAVFCSVQMKVMREGNQAMQAVADDWDAYAGEH